MRRGKRIVALNLKRPEAVEEALTLIETADALIEGNRPGVMERLGLGPADCAKRNPRLVYGRMTGWGQDGPLAQVAGHDLNYLALSGILSLAARDGQAPAVPPTVLGDGGGALGLAFGVVAAVFAAGRSGKGCVIDCSIVDIAASLGGIALAARAAGMLDAPSPSPFHNSPFYDVYACADGQYVTVGALEPQFYALSARQARPCGRRSEGAIRPRRLAGAESAVARAVPEPAERTLARAARGQRCVLRSGAEPRRGRGASAQ